MKMRTCASTGLELPVIGVGCWSFGGGDYWGEQGDAAAAEVLDAALEVGCVYLDTAEAYNAGDSEAALGRLLADRPRERFIVGSKVGPANCHPDTLREHCEASLKRLGLETLDLYMIHWPLNEQTVPDGPVPNLADALGALQKLQAEGKLRHLGVSNFGVQQLKELVRYAVPVAVNQLAYAMTMRAIEFEVLPLCQLHGIGVIGYMPLMQGLLSGKYAAADELPPQRCRTRHYRGDRPGARHGEDGQEELLFDTVGKVKAIAEREGMPLPELALAWSVANPAVTCTLAGARDGEQLRQNAAAGERELDDELKAELDAALDPLKNAMGRNCDYWVNEDEARTY